MKFSNRVERWWNPSQPGETLSGVIAEISKAPYRFAKGGYVTLCRVEADDGVQTGFTVGQTKWVNLWRTWQQVNPGIGDRIITTYLGRKGQSAASAKLFELAVVERGVELSVEHLKAAKVVSLRDYIRAKKSGTSSPRTVRELHRN